MEEIKELINAITNLPQLAVWVLAGYLVYKLATIGALYATIRFVAEKAFGYLSLKKTNYVETRVLMDGMLTHGTAEAFMNQMRRLPGIGQTTKSNYIYNDHIKWLREAIDDKIAKDEKSNVHSAS